MDFHEMKRKELQALCKKHGVPANLTNSEMADRLHRLLQNPKSAPQGPISLEPSVLDPSDKGNGVNAAQSTRKQPKKVRFSPENQTFIFEASSHITVGRTKRRRKSCVPSKADDGQTEISGIDEGLKKRNGKFSVRVTRSRAAMIMESNDVDADLPIVPKKRGRLKKEEKSTTEKYDRGTEKVSVKTDKASGKLAKRQLRSRQITVLEDTDSVENAQKRPRRSARQEIQPANKNIEAKGTTTAPCSKSVISKNEEAGNGERIGVFETEKATKADCRRGPSTRRRQTLMVTSSSAAIAELDIQESIVEVKKGREAVMGSSSSSVVDLVEDETHVGKQNKELKKKRKWVTGTGAGHSDEKVVRRSPRSASVIISNMKEAPVLKASENQKESDEYRVRELEDEAPGGKSLALPASATAMITRTLNSNSLDKAPEFTAKHCNKQVRRSARTASVSSSNISVDPMAKASEKERATEGLDSPVKSSSSMPIRRSGRNTSESTLHISIAPVTEASEANIRGECRMERIEEEGPLTRHRRTRMVTSNSEPVTELDIQNSITGLKKQKRPFTNKETDVTWLQNEINSTDSLMAASVKDGISVVGQHMKLKMKRKAARGTRRGTVYEKMVRSSRNTASASTMDVSVAEASASGCRMAKIQEEVLGNEKLMLPGKGGEGNFTSTVRGSANINSSHGALEFSDGSHGSKQVRRSARVALVSSSDALISPVKITSAKKEESGFITCIEKESPAIGSPPLENITNSRSEACESSDKGYTNKQVRSSAQIALLSSSGAIIAQTKRASGKKRGSESRRTSTEEKIPEIKSLLLPEKTTESTSGALEFSDKGCNDKQIMRFACMASACASDASIGPVTRASGKKRGSKSRRTSTEEEIPEIKSPLLPEKTTESTSGALEFSDKGCNDKDVMRFPGMASASVSNVSIGPVTRASGLKRECESRIIGIEEEGLGIKSPSLPKKILDSSCGALEFSDRGYSSKQVRRSARMASSTSLDASIGPKTRGSGKKRESESRISSIKVKAPGIQSPLLNKMTDSSYVIQEFSGKGYSSKQIRRSARVTSITFSADASVGPTLSASGRESECRTTNIEETTPDIESSLLEKVTDSTSRALGFSDEVYSSKYVRRSVRVASTTSPDASIGLVKRASTEKRESESRITGIEEETSVNGSPSLLLKTDSSNEALEFSDKGCRNKQVRRSERLASLSPLDASVGPMIKVSENKTESKSSTASKDEGGPGNQGVLLLKKMTDSEVEFVTVNRGRPAQLLDSNSRGGTLDVSGKSSNTRKATRSVHNTSPSIVHSSVSPTIKSLEANIKGGCKMVSIEEEDSGSADSKRCKNKQLGDSGSDAYLSPLHASVSPLGTEALEASSDRRMASAEEEAHCSGSLSSSPDKTANEKVQLPAPDSATITKNLGSNRSGGASDFSGRSVYNMTEGLMTGYCTHGQLEIAEGEKDSAHADTGASDGNAFFSTSDTAAGELALENKRESEDVIAAIPEKTQCIQITDPVHIEIVCQADKSTSAQMESSGFQLEVPPGDESVNFKCNEMGSNDGTSFQGGQQVIMEAINMTDAKSLDELTREDSTNEASGFCESGMDLKERSLLSVSCTEITEKLSVVHNSLITDETCEEELECSSKNDDRLAAPSELTSESQDAVQVTESAIDNEAVLSQMKQADTVTEEIRIHAAVECPISESLASDMILREVHEGEHLLHDARNEISQAMDINYEVEGDDMHVEAVEHKGDLHAVSVGKSNIEDGVVETAASLECEAKDKSESPETLILEIQECKDVNEESGVESSICAVEHKGDLHAVSVGKSNIQEGVVEIAASLECDAKNKSGSLETFNLEIQECKDINEESRVESSICAVEHKGDLHAVSVGKSYIQDGVVEIAASLECDAKDKSESLEAFILEIQECKDVNEESRGEPSICAVEHKGDFHAVAEGKCNIQDGVVEMAASLDCDAKDKPEALETFILEIQECKDVNEESRVESSMELDGLLKMKEMGSDDEYLPLLDKEDDNSFQFNNVKDSDSSDQSAQPCKSSCPLEKNIELTESKRDGIMNFEQDADAKDFVPSAQGVHQLVSLKESDLSSLDAELVQENDTNPQDRSYEICDVERDREQIASPGIFKGSEKQEAVISSHFTCPVMQNNRIAESPCSTNNCDKTTEAQSNHGVENQVESCGWKVGAVSNTEGIYDVNVKDIEHDVMLEADEEQVMTDDVVFHGVLHHQIFTGNIHDGSNNMDKNVGKENEAEHSEDKFSSGETREEFFFDHTARRFEGPTPAEEWNIDGIKMPFITTEGNNDLNVDEGKGEKMFEADKECVIGGGMIPNVAHDPEMLVQAVHTEAESADASLNLNSNEFRDHKGTAGLKDASKHSTEKGHYLFAERELKGQISGHFSETMLKSRNNENLEHQSANLQMATDHSAVSSTIFTAEEHETHDWLDIAFTLLEEDKDGGSKVGVTDAATPAVLGDDVRATSEHGDANMIGSCSNDESKDVCPDKISEEAFCEGSRLPSAGEQSLNTKLPGSTMMTKKSKTCFIPRKTKQFKGLDMKDQPGNEKPQLGSLTASKRRPTRPVWK